MTSMNGGKPSSSFLDNAKRTVCEVWTRLSAMGYCRPVSNFNKGKKSEYKERKCFTEKAAINGMRKRFKDGE